MKKSTKHCNADVHYRRYFKALSADWTKKPSICNEPEILQQYFKELTKTQDSAVRVRKLHLSIQMARQMFYQATLNESAFKQILKHHKVDFGLEMNPLNSFEIDDEQDVESMPDSPIEIKFTSYDQPPMPERAFEEVYYFAK
ncbi:uncharacterized protein LOC118767757 [Octopus sinensis]|uniref:Uncharacterized protein LOC118767757 n=1 Tax=Octopus sinensis TaxID=2607531 RepID=A0A7E6FM68_9MOLL|nr:uncharacterized protein LOC118767757 [Octopus sinensis]XP_036368751.1 uncharacterized protein LOC118767757 [Octopus sinensis]XP_036368752.1 uncharacterized protein LOC118767757 [Octopus sinensis]XP_036368753.1 uncharacterized protein LOC118767757 [Octopus sinensis]